HGLFAEELESGFRVGRRDGLQAGVGQIKFQQAPHFGFIFDNQDSGHRVRKLKPFPLSQKLPVWGKTRQSRRLLRACTPRESSRDARPRFAKRWTILIRLPTLW